MTDYDATIAHLKLAAMRELRKRASAPFSVPQGDLPGFYEETLNAVLGPMAQRLMAALIARDQAEAARLELQGDAARWQGTAEALARDVDHGLNEIGRLQDALVAEHEVVNRLEAQIAEALEAVRQLEANTNRARAYREATEGLEEGTLGRYAEEVA